MRQEERENLEQQLQDVPYGSVTTIRHTLPGQGEVLLTDRFSARTKGKGKLDVYQPLPGVEASYSRLIGTEVTVCHEASHTILELFYCRRGRVGWNMRGGISVYLGAGDLSVHSADCCADSRMMFPLGYAEGLSVSLDLAVLEKSCPRILRAAGGGYPGIAADLLRGKARCRSGRPATGSDLRTALFGTFCSARGLSVPENAGTAALSFPSAAPEEDASAI